jgi:hypothetical protein
MKFRLLGYGLLLWCSMVAIGDAGPPAEPRVAVQIKKTFDYGTLIEHTLTAAFDGHTVVAIYSQRRSAQGSNRIESAGLSYRPYASGSKPLDQHAQQALLTEIIHRLEARFKEGLKLTYFISSGYLNAQGTVYQNLMAFHEYAPWIEYLNSPAPQDIAQHKTYAMVVQRWKEKGVYADVIELFNDLGYALELEGFEKLFVQRADAFAGYAQLQPQGVLPQERFPYPGSIQFSVQKNKGVK